MSSVNILTLITVEHPHAQFPSLIHLFSFPTHKATTKGLKMV